MSLIKLAIIGTGAMGSAIALGLVGAKVYKAEEILLCDADTSKLETFKAEGFKSVTEISKITGLIQEGLLETLIIAVKPKDMGELLSSLSSSASHSGSGTQGKPSTQTASQSDSTFKTGAAATLIISIAAGITLATYEKYFTQNPIVRVMPNTPAQVQRGASVLAPNAKVTHQDLDRAMRIFESLGITLVMDESKLDAVTALSGSGPAYIFYLIEAMVEAGIELGLSASEAEKLSVATAYGSGFLAFSKMHHELAAEPSKVLETMTDTARKLREQVTSPNGTTHAAISHMEAKGMREIIRSAIRAARDRSIELAKT